MLIEDVQLRLSHVDLGHLDEYGALCLMGDAFLERITRDTGGTFEQIRDGQGQSLYPGYFMTHLCVSPRYRLDRFGPWGVVSVGVDIRAFGKMILESQYLLGSRDSIPRDVGEWSRSGYPYMRAGNMFVVEGTRDVDTQPAIPKDGTVADVPRMATPPACIAAFTTVQRDGQIVGGFKGRLRTASPISYELRHGRDLRVGHAVMFATLVRIMDEAERRFLTEHIWPPCPGDLVLCAFPIERETYFLGNCHEESMLEICIAGSIGPATGEVLASSDGETTMAGEIELATEVFDRRSGRLLAVARAKKAFAVPGRRKVMLREAERFVKIHGAGG